MRALTTVATVAPAERARSPNSSSAPSSGGPPAWGWISRACSPLRNVQTAWSASWARFWIRVRIWRRRPADASLFGLVAAPFFAAVAVLVVSGRLDVAATGSHAHIARRHHGRDGVFVDHLADEIGRAHV